MSSTQPPRRARVSSPSATPKRVCVEDVRKWEDENEPILQRSFTRLVGRSGAYPRVWDMAQNLIQLYWRPDVANLIQDLADWKKLTDDERRVVERIHAFFATADGIVNANIQANFLSRIETPEHVLFYESQVGNEAVHKVVYANILQTLVTDPRRIEQLIAAVETDTHIAAKAQWAFKYMDQRNATLADQMLAFVCVEGIQFCASFLILFYFRDRGLLPGITAFNSWIARDETLHMEFGAHVYRNDLVRKSERAEEIIREAVELECAFVSDMMGDYGLQGLPTDKVCEYVRYCADYIAREVGMEPLYGAKNHFAFMNLLGIDTKTMFFERRPTNYSGHSGAAPPGVTLVDDSF